MVVGEGAGIVLLKRAADRVLKTVMELGGVDPFIVLEDANMDATIERFKFGKLHDYARQIDASFVASGHYARIERSDPARPRLLRGPYLETCGLLASVGWAGRTETVSRVLARFQKAGVVKVDRKQVRILDMDELKTIARKA